MFSWTLVKAYEVPSDWAAMRKEWAAWPSPHASPFSPLQWELLQDLPAFDRFITETLRWSSVVPMGFRAATGDLAIDGKYVPAGWTVAYGLDAYHHDAANFKEPERFCPMRYLTPGMASVEPMPFGGGPHTCLGMGLFLLEMKALLVLIQR